jgi:cobyrinic acid a,c-diamide synthase
MPWAGVLANRVASERQAQMLESALNAGPDGSRSTWLGAVMRDERFTLPERHLGLTVAAELPDALARLDAAADALAATELGQMDMGALSRWTVDFDAPLPAQPVPPLLQGRTVAVARDAAFCFIYPANVDTLQALGAKLVFFSPLANEPVPPCDAVWLPGGYPELHGATLANSHACQESIAAHVAAGKPVWAECGGMMVLFDAVMDAEGHRHDGWGVLTGIVRMQKRLAALGPHQLSLAAGGLRGHTFHYSVCDTTMQPVARTAPVRVGAVADGEALYAQGAVRASYFHAWFASNPEAAASLFLPEAVA